MKQEDTNLDKKKQKAKEYFNNCFLSDFTSFFLFKIHHFQGFRDKLTICKKKHCF